MIYNISKMALDFAKKRLQNSVLISNTLLVDAEKMIREEELFTKICFFITSLTTSKT